MVCTIAMVCTLTSDVLAIPPSLPRCKLRQSTPRPVECGSNCYNALRGSITCSSARWLSWVRRRARIAAAHWAALTIERGAGDRSCGKDSIIRKFCELTGSPEPESRRGAVLEYVFMDAIDPDSRDAERDGPGTAPRASAPVHSQHP